MSRRKKAGYMTSHNIQPDILITLDTICKYCIQYDKYYYSYPESEWEGIGVFDYIIDCMESDHLLSSDQANKIRHDITEKIYIQKPYNREL